MQNSYWRDRVGNVVSTRMFSARKIFESQISAIRKSSGGGCRVSLEMGKDHIVQ